MTSGYEESAALTLFLSYPITKWGSMERSLMICIVWEMTDCPSPMGSVHLGS